MHLKPADVGRGLVAEIQLEIQHWGEFVYLFVDWWGLEADLDCIVLVEKRFVSEKRCFEPSGALFFGQSLALPLELLIL